MNLKIQKSKIDKVVKLLETISEEGTIEITKEHLKARGIDPSHVCLIDIQMESNDEIKNNHYKIDSESKITFDPTEFRKALSVFKPEDNLEIKNTKSKIHITNENKSPKVELRLFENPTNETPIPKLKKEVVLELDNPLDMTQYAQFGDYIEFEMKSNKLNVEIENDNMKYEGTIKTQKQDGEGKATFSIQYITDFLKVCKDTYDIEFGTAKPLQLTEKLLYMDKTEEREITYGYCTLFLAPRVET